MSMQEHFSTTRDNLFAASQIMPVVADSLTVAANQTLKRGSLLNASGVLIAATTPGVKASGTATFSANVSANDTITIGETTLKFVSATPGDDEVLIGSTVSDTIDNLIAALPEEVTGSKASSVLTITAAAAGTAGNSIALAKSASNITLGGLSDGKLSGGVDQIVDTNVYAVLAEDVDTTDAAKDAAVYLTGEFNESAIIVSNGVTVAECKVNARKVGIFIKPTIPY